MARNRLRAIGRVLIIFASLLIGILIGCGIAAARGKECKESNSEIVVFNENTRIKYAETNAKKFSLKYEETSGNSASFVIGSSGKAFVFRIVQEDLEADLSKAKVILNHADFYFDTNKAELLGTDANFVGDHKLMYNGNKQSGKDNFEISLAYDGEIQSSIIVKLIEETKSVWDWVMGILSSAVGTTLSITAGLTVLWRAVLKVYNMGKTDKKSLVSKDEFKEFEDSMRKDMRGYATQIQKSCTESVMNVVEREMKPMDDIKETADNMKIVKAQVDSSLKNIEEKYDEIKQIGDTVRVLNVKVNRLEYGKETASERRTE